MLRRPSFRDFKILWISKMLNVQTSYFVDIFVICLDLCEVSWGLQGEIILVLGLNDTLKSPEIIEMMDLRVLIYPNRKVTSSK